MEKMSRAIRVCKAAALCEDALGAKPPEEDTTQEKKLASAVADRLTAAIFSNRKHAHALRDIAHNEKNKSILLIMHPVANHDIDEVVKALKAVPDVLELSDNIVKDDVNQTEFHVLKVKIVEEEPCDTDEEGVYDLDCEDGRYEVSDEEEPQTPVYGPGSEAEQSSGPDFS